DRGAEDAGMRGRRPPQQPTPCRGTAPVTSSSLAWKTTGACDHFRKLSADQLAQSIHSDGSKWNRGETNPGLIGREVDKCRLTQDDLSRDEPRITRVE